ncbi:alpha-N-acetylglucosaminidase [Aplysia californica]|uniref:Alpha-N-acetylglucosaminidase n=1 Tax=Aplysia californica TaxID=6500 RepID=A0ABM1ADD1_APLCA|nr:alpha-N-acetylglucosaminidase [Aplysia californica]
MFDRGRLLLLLSAVCVCHAVQDFPQLSHVRTKTSAQVQREAALDVIGRLVRDRASDFEVRVDQNVGPKDKDTFKLSSIEGGRILIEGTSGVAVSMGFYHYLKYWCNAQRTWAGQQTELPATLPLLDKPVVVTTHDKFRYYKNVCTESYSFAFWQWDRWEQEIDWMALHGINMPLAFTGQEAIFQRVYLNLGLTQAELDEHFGGPAFLAWARMGNLRRWGGPLPQMWITNQLLLQHKVLQRMRSLGMTPVLPGFAGHVPQNLTRVFPNANVTRMRRWSQFNSTYTATYLLQFEDPLFQKIGGMFIQEMTLEFGTDHVYNADTFNEMEPLSSDPKYIRSAGKAVYSGLLAGDPQAIWLMQGWLFLEGYWKPPLVKALVTSVPIGRMIILDLASELNPLFSRFESYYGQPFIWCMIHNFGGTNELYGAVDAINVGPFNGRKFPNSSMIGIGLTPEGINQNEVMYEFMMENAWRTEPRDVDQWVVSYAHQRYGADNRAAADAWTRLIGTVYNCSDGHHDNDRVFLTRRPSTKNSYSIWYKPRDLFLAWEGFVNASNDLAGSQLFQYDITDVTRNSLQIISLYYYFDMMSAFQKNDSAGVQAAGVKMSGLLADMDHVLSANDRFLVGGWIADAKSWATDADETKLLEYNARNQITLWGPDGEIVDYASKQWAGVVADYYKPRWEFFSTWLTQLIKNGSRFDGYIFNKNVMAQVETPWTVSTYPYPTEPTGDAVAISRALLAKYQPVIHNPFFQKIYEMSQKQPKRQKVESLIRKKFRLSSDIPVESGTWQFSVMEERIRVEISR